jgi:2'-5' RNA ligase
MSRYLIEFRFFGAAKKEMKRLIYEVDRKFKLGHARRKRPVPHISLAGPLTTNNERRLLGDFKRLCHETRLMKLHIRGYGTFDNTRVVFINVEPSERMDEFRWKLSQTLQSYCSLRPHDLERKFYYHATVAMKIPPQKFGKIKNYVKRKPKMDKPYILTRVTLLRNAKILCEYDFLQRRTLTRLQALNRNVGETNSTAARELLLRNIQSR